MLSLKGEKMTKSHLAEKNNIKHQKKTIKAPAQSSDLETKFTAKSLKNLENFASDDKIKDSMHTFSKNPSKKTIIDEIMLDSTTLSPTPPAKELKKNKSVSTKAVNESSHSDENAYKTELLDPEESDEDSFDIDDADDIPHSAKFDETEYFDDTDIDDFDDRVYELTSYNHSNDLPVPTVKYLPSPLIRDNLQLYIREASKFPLLKPEEEIELARRVRDEGDSDAAFRIISSHLRLVVKISMDFQRRWMQNVLDLIQEGNVGLMRAVNKFDPDKGIKFSYYATFWIKAYILKFIMDNWRMVKIGTTQAQRKLFYNLNKERQKLIAQGFNPDASALSEALGVSVDQVVEMQQRLDTGDMSLDLPVNDENGSASRIDFFPALGPGIEDLYAELEIANLIHDGISGLLPKLSDKETFILENRLLTDDPVTLREIGEKYNVTRERIRQLEARLLVKLRNHLGEEIKDFSESWIQP